MIKVIRFHEQPRSSWAGGQTTELLIYPPGSVYSERNFAVRVSSATVEAETSEFTPLPGFTRYITPLEGTMELTHNGQGKAALAPFRVHRFSGEWATVSRGKCVDFNLMLAEGWEGGILAVSSGGVVKCPAREVFCLYALNSLNVFTQRTGETYQLDAGDALCVFDCPEDMTLSVTSRVLEKAAVYASARFSGS